MPTAVTGQKIKNIDRTSNFLRVTGEGQKVLLRFATNSYAYEGKHFSEYVDGSGEKKLKIEDCPKINENLQCDKCDQYWQTVQPNKELRAKLKATEDKAEKAKLQVQIDEIREKARPYQVKISFYYPVLKRATAYGEQSQSVIFQTSLQVRQRLEEVQNLGYDITKYDFTILCTKKLPNYYIVDRLDSERMKPLSDEETRLLAEAKGFDLGRLLEGRKIHESSEEEVTERQVNEEQVETSETTNPTPAQASTTTEAPEQEDLPF